MLLRRKKHPFGIRKNITRSFTPRQRVQMKSYSKQRKPVIVKCGAIIISLPSALHKLKVDRVLFKSRQLTR